MKVLYIAHYKEKSLDAQMAINNIRALEAADVDVVCRPLIFNQKPETITPSPSCLRHLERKDINGVTAVVQHTYPHFFEYIYGVKNIGFVSHTTSNFNMANWNECCNLMDQIWVPNRHAYQCCINSDVRVDTKIVEHAVDIMKFQKQPEPFNLGDKFKFYCITNIDKNANIPALIRAYYATFNSKDNVCLVIKPTSNGREIDEIFKKMISDIKNAIHIYNEEKMYPPIMIINQDFSDEQLDRLHATCNVFVSTNHAIPWPIHAHNALGFGNRIIVSDYGGNVELCKTLKICPYEYGSVIGGQMTFVFGVIDKTNSLYTGIEKWFDIDIGCLSKTMMEMYKQKISNDIRQQCRNNASMFRYKAVGHNMRELISDE